MRIFAIIISLLILIGVDMSSKYFVEQSVFGSWQEICAHPESNSAATSEYCEDNRISIIGEYFGIQLAYNPGVAFSLPIRGIYLQILTVLLIVGIIYQYIREEYPKKSKLLDTGYVLILAWALAHAYERIFVGHVIDFIAVKYFAILNFADIFISIGAFCIIIYYFYYGKHNAR